MGVDVKAYKGLSRVDNPILDEDNELGRDNHNQDFIGENMSMSEKRWPGVGGTIREESVYTWVEAQTFVEFSYSGAEEWIEQFRKFKNKYAADSTLFDHFIELGFTHGVIGIEACRQLASEFSQHLNAAMRYACDIKDGDVWIKDYTALINAFNYALDNGAIELV